MKYIFCNFLQFKIIKVIDYLIINLTLFDEKKSTQWYQIIGAKA